MARTAMLRFDASPAVGGGHMARCLALADALESRGFGCVYRVNAEAVGWLDEPRRARTGVAEGQDAAACAPSPRDAGVRFDAAVVDRYGLCDGFEQSLRSFSSRIVAIDDLADRLMNVDIVVNSAPGAQPHLYDNRVPDAALRLTGPDYALLRAEFRDNKSMNLKSADAIPGKPSLLVSLGATDPADATSAVLAAVLAGTNVGRVTVVLARGAAHASKVRAAVQASQGRARLLENVADMPTLCASHDLAIGAPATSALERACLGLPQILIETAVNQHAVAAGFAAAGAANCIGRLEQLTTAVIINAIRDLAQSADLRRRLARAGRDLVDGRGADRVAALIAAEPTDKAGRRLSARRLRRDDAALMLAWQRHPATRRFARNPAIPTPQEHRAWLDHRLDADVAVSEVVARDGTPVAIVRADPIPDGHEVSLVVAPETRGQGIGAAALQYLDSLMAGRPLTAVVHPDNAASLATFRSAGYGASPSRLLRIETPADTRT